MTICEHCGFESQGVPTCPLCGTALESEAVAAPHEALVLPAWEDPIAAFPASLVSTWRESLFSPARFFAGVPWGEALARPILYYLVIVIIGAAFTLFWESVGIGDFLTGEFGEMGLEQPFYSPIANFFLTPFIWLIILFGWAAVLHLFVLMLAPERRSFGATTRAVCYAVGPAVFSVIPIGGGLVSFAWWAVLQVFAVQHAHRVSGGRASAIVLLPLGLLLFGFIALTVIVLRLIGFLTDFGTAGLP